MKTMATVHEANKFEVGTRVEYMGDPKLLDMDFYFNRGEVVRYTDDGLSAPVPVVVFDQPWDDERRRLAELTVAERTRAVAEEYLIPA
jgi:hypothetical protein